MQDLFSAMNTTQMMTSTDFDANHHKDLHFKPLDFHSHDFLEVFLFLDGLVTYYIEDIAYELSPGSLLLIPSGIMHRPVISNESIAYERIVIWLNSHYIKKLDNKTGLLNSNISKINSESGYLISLKGEDINFVISIFNKLIEIKNAPDMEVFCASLIRTFFLFSFDKFAQNEKEAIYNNEDLIPKVIRHINENYMNEISLDTISNVFFVSKSNLLRKFKIYTNSTVYDYIISVRISNARRLMRNGLTATQAGRECGFTDYSNFYKAFYSKTGVNPATFKAQLN